MHYGAAKAGRGELLECVEVLALMRSAALGPLIARIRGRRPQGVRRIEDFAPEFVHAMAATIGAQSREGCMDALRAAAHLYQRLREQAADSSLHTREAAEREALVYLDSLR